MDGSQYCDAELAAKRVHRVAKTLDGVAQTAQRLAKVSEGEGEAIFRKT